MELYQLMELLTRESCNFCLSRLFVVIISFLTAALRSAAHLVGPPAGVCLVVETTHGVLYCIHNRGRARSIATLYYEYTVATTYSRSIIYMLTFLFFISSYTVYMICSFRISVLRERCDERVALL